VFAVARNSQGFWVWLFGICSGVIQGCTLSGLLFPVASDPWLNEMKAKIVDTGVGRVFACADDVGMVLFSIRSLIIAQEVFKHAETLALLKLKPVKCMLVPLSKMLPATFDLAAPGPLVCISSSAEFADVRAWCKLWLQQFLPSWATFSVDSSAVYLTARLGPTLEGKQLDEPIAKWVSRSRLVAEAGAAPLASASLYNSRALSVTCYLAQFVLPARWFVLELLEQRMLTRIFKFPYIFLHVAVS